MITNLRVTQMIGGNEHWEEILSEAGVRIRCSIPCIVQSYNSDNNTVECQPAIREEMLTQQSTVEMVNLPLLINVPVVFPFTGNYGIKFPIKPGDEVLVVFSDLSIDNFWLKGNVQNPVETRRHDLSDGIAIPACLSLPKQNMVPKTSITFSDSDLTFKAGENSTSILSLLQEINSLATRLGAVEGRLITAEGKIQTLENKVQTLESHKHTVTVGDNTYQTSTPI